MIQRFRNLKVSRKNAFILCQWDRRRNMWDSSAYNKHIADVSGICPKGCREIQERSGLGHGDINRCVFKSICVLHDEKMSTIEDVVDVIVLLQGSAKDREFKVTYKDLESFSMTGSIDTLIGAEILGHEMIFFSSDSIRHGIGLYDGTYVVIKCRGVDFVEVSCPILVL